MTCRYHLAITTMFYVTRYDVPVSYYETAAWLTAIMSPDCGMAYRYHVGVEGLGPLALLLQPLPVPSASTVPRQHTEQKYTISIAQNDTVTVQYLQFSTHSIHGGKYHRAVSAQYHQTVSRVPHTSFTES